MGVKGIFLPSLFYKCTISDSELVCHDQNNYDKLLYSYYTKNNEIVLNQKKWATDTIEIGDTIYVGFKEKRQIVKDISNLSKSPWMLLMNNIEDLLPSKPSIRITKMSRTWLS
jgi:hypothetical protein